MHATYVMCAIHAHEYIYAYTYTCASIVLFIYVHICIFMCIYLHADVTQPATGHLALPVLSVDVKILKF